MADILKAILLGIVQGLTEFFPISSSAHLKFAKYLLNISDNSPFLELSCHFGTAACLIWYLRYDIKKIVMSPSKLSYMILALIPLIPAYFFFKPIIFQLSSLKYVGIFYCISALLLFFSSRISVKPSNPKRLRDYLFIGSMQSIALFPGISRSGATISAARMRGWSLKEAAVFSFLLSIPTIIGGLLLEIWKSNTEYVIFKETYLIAALSAFFTGFLTIRLFFIILKKKRFSIFAWYCLAIGILICIYD